MARGNRTAGTEPACRRRLVERARPFAPVRAFGILIFDTFTRGAFTLRGLTTRAFGAFRGFDPPDPPVDDGISPRAFAAFV